jgi:histidinol-phosphate aminotransferase
MTIALSRRFLLGGASAGTALALGGALVLAEAKPPRSMFGPSPGLAWLTFNENPYGPSPRAIAAMAEAASKGCYYPDEATDRLQSMIAERFGVGHNQVVVGNGSTELLTAAALALGRKGAIVCPELFYDAPVLYAGHQGAHIIRVPLRPNMGVDVDAMATAARESNAALVYLCNPNNPTAMMVESDRMRSFINSLPAATTVLVDEAYNEITDQPEANSIVDLVRGRRNVIVCRTFSKIYGLAGLRVGYALTTPDHARMIQDNLMTLDLSSASLAAAIASFNDSTFMRFSKGRILEGRQMILDATHRLGLETLPTQANFVFVRVPDADVVKSRMAARGIVIRGTYGKWKNWSRVSTGKIEDVSRYVAALPTVIRA